MNEESESTTKLMDEDRKVLYQSIINTSIDGYALLDNKGLIQDVNQSFCEMTGYEKKELLNLSLSALQEQSENCLPQLAKQCVIDSFRFETSLIKKDGTDFLSDINASPLSDHQEGWILFLKKIGAENKYKLDKNSVPNLLKELFNLTPNLFYVYDLRANRNLFTNVSVGEMLGYSSKEIRMMGENLLPTLMHPDDLDNYIKNLAPQFSEMKNGEILQFSYRMQQKDGKWIWMESKESVFKRDKEGNPIQKIGVCYNITEKQMYLYNLEKDRKRLLAVLDGIEDVIYISDPDTYEILHVNKAVEHFFGKDIIGKKCHEVFQNLSSPCSFCTNDIIMGEKLGEMYLWEFQNEANKRWYRCADKAVKWINGKMVRFELATDITEIKKLQNEVIHTNEKLKHSNEDLEQFAYIASHDLQEPLRMVSSYSQLLSKRYAGKLDEKADMYIHHAVDGALRMQNLIRDLLEFSRVTTRGNTLKEADCHEILGQTLKDLKRRIDKSGAVIDVGRLPVIKVDAIQIQRVFQNLISNAIKFRGKGNPVISISSEKQKDFWHFAVKDNGIGIDPKFKDIIFVIFQRLHSRGEYSGTGIGLAVCKRIINRHGGEIWLESTLGEGTTFHFTLPVNPSKYKN